jgi:hypothetical protein
MSATASSCDRRNAGWCNFPEGACTCIHCPDGLTALTPGDDTRGFVHCERNVCTTHLRPGGRCVTGTHCGVCAGEMWDCKHGRWVLKVVPPEP